MKKSTKILLFFGLVLLLFGPAILNPVGFFSSSCWEGGGGCADGVVLVVLGVMLYFPAAYIVKKVYNFVYNKLPAGTSSGEALDTANIGSRPRFELKRTLLTLGIIGGTTAVLFFSYWAIRDNQDAKSMQDWNTQQSACVKFVESQTIAEKCDGETYPLRDNCLRVDVTETSANEGNGGQATYYLDKKLFEDCLKTTGG